MYFDRVLKVWVVDPLDCFLLSALVGSLVASSLKDYLSEKKAMKRLKQSIIKKLKSLIKLDRPISNSKAIRMKKIYELACESRGGFEVSNEVFKLSRQIKEFVERLANFLKEQELKGFARIFFKNRRLILELILHTWRIDITYSLLTEGLSTQVIVITATAGGAAGFTLSWFSAGASLVALPLLIST